jgi:enamine deaminase RidA (YjgF/YER057c/UK114 family)
MAIERIWPNDVYIRKAPHQEGKVYAQVVKASDTRARIHVAGTMSFDQDQNMVGEGDMRLQVRTILENIRRSLAAVGATPRDVVRVKTYVTNMDAFLREGSQEYAAFFADGLPASTLVGVTALTDPRCMVEIEAYAEV